MALTVRGWHGAAPGRPKSHHDMNLSHEQRELLSAYLDGEVSANERALAQALLDRAEARRFLGELKTLRERLAPHGLAPAPRNLRDAVLAALDGDFDSISRPTSLKPGREAAVLPSVNWRTPLMAVAAALTIAVGLFFGSALLDRPADVSTATVSRAPDAQQAGSRAMPTSRPSEVVEQTKPAKGGDHTNDDWSDDAGPPPAAHQPPKAPTGDGERGPAKNGDKKHDQDEARLAQLALTRTVSFDRSAEVSFSFDRKSRMSMNQLHTDLLGIASLYGNARLLTASRPLAAPAAGVDLTYHTGIEVELDESRVPELLGALDRLAAANTLGRVVTPGFLRPSVLRCLREVDELLYAVESVERGEVPKAESADEKPAPNAAEANRRVNSERKFRATDPSLQRAMGYLPVEVQRESARRLEEQKFGKVESSATPRTTGNSAPSASVKLVIRVQ